MLTFVPYLWALEELGMDYQVEYYQRSSSYAALRVLKQIHPLGKAPILVDDEECHCRIYCYFGLSATAV